MKGLARILWLVALFHQSNIAVSKLGEPILTRASNETSAEALPKAIVVPKEKRKLQSLVGLGGRPASQFIPLGLCQGDCDNDGECDKGLRCFKRNAHDPVPGCDGGESYNAGTDFCIPVGGTGTGTGTTTISNPSPPSARASARNGGSMGLCDGDCDGDSDCQNGLVCFQRSRGDPIPPECPSLNRGTQIDVCVPAPTQAAPAPTPAAPAPTPAAPAPTPAAPAPTPSGPAMGVCQGDCNTDSDCQSGLICYQRNSGEPIPQGCSGNINSPEDFCFDPHNLEDYSEEQDAGGGSLTNPFHLKMYWEEGYTWQDETIERKWCVMRDYNGYPGRGKCWYGLDTRPCNPYHVYTARCNNDDRQQWQFELVNDSEVLIKAYGLNYCLQRVGVEIEMRICNSGLVTQRFFAIRGGFNEYRFEISMKTSTRYCFNQAHHPKAGEVMAMYPCSRTRDPEHQTSWWELA
ncbi:expressed unknown protein [Seminavis robusta]|uniref:Uncharacterized protein n=1 Tax=Seminavis robusta TaxID=568900 RepID=A0A9N8HYB3_9STRA|nr:expressed unknown protein [Seminavis robusta]|eukprot:Sro1964_g308210.1 n/a (461) ;mRNA; f:12256-14277